MFFIFKIIKACLSRIRIWIFFACPDSIWIQLFQNRIWGSRSCKNPIPAGDPLPPPVVSWKLLVWSCWNFLTVFWLKQYFTTLGKRPGFQAYCLYAHIWLAGQNHSFNPLPVNGFSQLYFVWKVMTSWSIICKTLTTFYNLELWSRNAYFEEVEYFANIIVHSNWQC